MSLIVLACATAGLLLGKLDSTGYAAVVSIVSSIFLAAHVYQQKV